jgi:Pyruvate/2-oxoacid:ferredoxin oxidoreductase delta subunit/nitroreductase
LAVSQETAGTGAQVGQSLVRGRTDSGEQLRKASRENEMIVLDKEKCTGCGQCVKICHEHCMALVDHTVVIDYQYCSTCTQCVAACPQQALTWNGALPIPYDNSRLPSAEQLDELFKQRRTMRFFKEDKIDRPLLEEIVGYGIYALTNNFDLRAIVIDDQEIMAELDRVHVQYTVRLHNLLYRPRIVSLLARMMGVSSAFEQARPKVEAIVENGHSYVSPPAAIIFIVGDKRVPLSVESAQYALANMTYYAQAKGIGSRLWGPGQLFYDRSKTVRKRLGLERREHILGTVLLGYPAVKFRNKVHGKTLPIQWNDDEDSQGENQVR